MTTPLQKAAQAVIASITDDEWIEAYEELRKALDAELAQAETVDRNLRVTAQTVEPVADDIVAGALYDFLGYLTSRRTRITMSDRDDAGAAADALVDWSKTRKINLAEARVVDWNDYTHPPQPQATTVAAWKAEQIDDYEIRVTSPEGESWRLRSADKNDIFNNFIWRWAKSMIAAQGEKP